MVKIDAATPAAAVQRFSFDEREVVEVEDG